MRLRECCCGEVSSLPLPAALCEAPDSQALTCGTASASASPLPVILANPQQLHATRNQPRSVFGTSSSRGSLSHARYTSIDIISQGHALSQNSRPDALVMPSTANWKPDTAGWMALARLLASAVRPGQRSLSPDCSSTAPTTPSLSSTGSSVSLLLRTAWRRSVSPYTRSLLRETL
jgi:hypothetical protein